jgi:hypothetical protein
MKRSGTAGYAFLAMVCLGACLYSSVSGAQVSVTTWHNDNWRTGQNLNETILTTSNVNINTFGLVCNFKLSSVI